MPRIKDLLRKFLGFDEDNKEESLSEEFALEENFFQENVKEPIPEVKRNEDITLYPKTFGDACDIVEHLEKGYIVTIDMNDVDIDTCKRITDFVLGAIYVLNGDVEKISRKVFRFWLIK